MFLKFQNVIYKVYSLTCFILKGKRGNDDTNFFLHSPENYTFFTFTREKEESSCFVLPFEEKLLLVSLAVSLRKTQPVSLFCTFPVVSFRFFCNRCTKHRYRLFYISYLELKVIKYHTIFNSMQKTLTELPLVRKHWLNFL